MPKQFICQQCGKNFYYSPSSKRKYCSRACCNLGSTKPGSNNKLFMCESCGRNFVDTGWAKKRKYCSLDCSAESQKIRVVVICLNCGKSSERQKGWAVQADIHFCDRQCRDQYQSGEGHPKWKGGLIRYYGPSWHPQRAEVRKRDGNKCQHCGITSKKYGHTLDVHHLIPFRKFGLERHEEANELSNLILLCRSCHAQAEKGAISLQLKLITG